jgi:hypothetical protein
MGRACSMHGAVKNAYMVLVTKLWRKIPLGRSRHRWEDKIKMNLRKLGVSVDWI